MKKLKKISLIKIFLIVLSAAMLITGIFAFKGGTAFAYNSSNNMPSGNNAIGNIYDNGKFNADPLQKLAAAAKFQDAADMVDKAANGTVKTSADFGEITVELGSYTYKGTTYPLKWIPVYLSKSNSGKPILTLWLAGTSNANGTVSDQEVSTYSDGTWNNNATAIPSSSNYSTSMIRVKTLNNGGTYKGGYNNSSNAQQSSTLTSTSYTATSNGSNKFEMFTTGALKDYIVTPSDVSWQANASYMKNDPKWNATGNTWDKDNHDESGVTIMGTTANYPISWLNDKLWLPSMYETYDSSISSSGKRRWDFTDNGGLWKTSTNEKSNLKHSWLRSANPNYCYYAYVLDDAGSCNNCDVYYTWAVRPALHLDLESAADAAGALCPHTTWGEWATTTPSTCKTQGVETRACTLCGKTETKKLALDPNNHENKTETIIKQPDCTNKGEKTWSCTACGVTTKTEEIPALGHQDGDWIVDKEASCTEAGSKHQVCSVCNETIKTETIPIVAHTYPTEKTVTTQPTCIKVGIKFFICTVCGYKDENSREEIAVLGHDWGEGVITKQPDCTNKGVRTYTCSHENCPLKTKTEEIAAKGHDPQLTNQTAATCTDDGYDTYECSRCDYSYTQKNGEKTGHSWKTPIFVWATDFETCSVSFTCETCNEHVSLPATVTKQGGTASCTEAGDVVYTAKIQPVVGGDEYTETRTKYGQKLPHETDSEPTSVTTQPTCTTEGVGNFTCKNCGQTYTAKIPALGHQMGELVAAVEATCDTAGNVAYYHCSRCNLDFEDEEGTKQIANVTVEALGHDWSSWTVTKPATYLQDGERQRTCSRCKKVETEVLPKKESSGNKIVLTVNASYQYGDKIEPTATCEHGEVTISYYNAAGLKLPSAPVNVGTYKVVASVAEPTDGSYSGAAEEKEITITARKITVTINPASSILNAPLATLSATVTSGSIISGDAPYTLSTDANIAQLGEYTITGECTDTNYEITFEPAAYIVSKKISDPDHDADIDIPNNLDVVFKVTQSETSNDYSELQGMKIGYWAQLWYPNEDGTLGEEFTDKLNCILTLKIPADIIEAIRGGEAIDRDKIAQALTVYYIGEDGSYVPVKAFTIAQKENQNWIVKFNYNQKFRAEVVFNASAVEPIAPVTPETEKGGIPWWVWLVIALAIIILIIIIVVIAVKKKHAPATETVMVGGYDDSELKQRMEEQNGKIDALLSREPAVDPLNQTLTDDEMRSFFTNDELADMVRQGKISQEDCDRVIKGRK